MAANLFGRYVWLMDILRRHKRLTFEEINELWQESGLSYGEELPLKTFHNHKKAIKDIFDVYIECDRKDGYRYYIDEPERIEGNNLRSWLISSYATLNQIKADNKLEDRIIFEEIPSGQTWLTCIKAGDKEPRGGAHRAGSSAEGHRPPGFGTSTRIQRAAQERHTRISRRSALHLAQA